MDRLSKRSWIVLVAVVILLGLIAVLVWTRQTDKPLSSEEVLQAQLDSLIRDCGQDPTQWFDPEVVKAYPNYFSWVLFIYLNCAPTDTAVIWEGWATNRGVYLAGGIPPQPWGSPQLTAYALEDLPEISGHRATTLNGDPILSEIRMNQPNFTYIVQNQLYNKDCQIAFFEGIPCSGDNNPIVFPLEALEIKTAWVILTPNDPINDRYFTLDTSYIDRHGNSQQALVGLAGFHITSKMLPNWLWATFEQIDNPAVTGIQPLDPIPPDVQAMNQVVQASFAESFPDLPWQYYELRGSQIDFVDEQGQPTVLANTLIETDFQRSSSCITCHALATRGSLAQGRLAFFNITDEGMQGYIGDVAGQDYHDSFGNPVCYDGTSDYFVACDTGENVYRQLDFVWSLRGAD